jgi:hypothetical protein
MTCPHCGQRTDPGDLTCPACGEVLLALPSGTRLYHRYRVLRALGRTGGVSYLAEDEEHQRQVLLLEFFPPGSRRLGTLAILPEGTDSRRQDWLTLLHQRTEVMGSSLQRPQTVFEQHGTAYAVTALPLGEALLTRVQAGRLLDPAEAMAMLTTLAQGVQELQRQGRQDGRLGPHRISLTPAGARLDLGWAEEVQAAYVAPEQTLNPPRTSQGSDVYALAALTIFALTGQAPATAGQRGLGQALPALPVGLPAQLRQAIERGMTLSSSERLPDAAALLRLLKSSGTASRIGTPVPAPQKVQVVPAHRSWLTHVHTDGERVVTAGADLRVRVFDRRGQPLGQYDGLRGRPMGLAMGDHGVVIGDESGTVTVWRGGVDSPQNQAGHWRMTHLIVRPGGQAVTIQEDGALGVWELSGPRQLGQEGFRPGRLTALQATADDSLLLGTVEGQVQLFDEMALLTTTLWQHPDRRAVTELASSPTAPGMAAAAAGQSVILIDQDREVLTLEFQEPVTALTFLPDGTALVVAGRSGGLHHVGLQSGQRRLLYRSPAPMRTVAWTKDLLVAGNEAGQLLIVPIPE